MKVKMKMKMVTNDSLSVSWNGITGALALDEEWVSTEG
jgi:hypothetical protein